MARRCTRRSLPNYFDMKSYHWNVRQKTITWHWWKNSKNNVTFMHKMQSPWEYCANFNSTLVICLKFVFIEMLDKLITYIWRLPVWIAKNSRFLHTFLGKTGWSSTSDRNFILRHSNFYHERKITRAFPTTHVSTYFLRKLTTFTIANS